MLIFDYIYSFIYKIMLLSLQRSQAYLTVLYTVCKLMSKVVMLTGYYCHFSMPANQSNIWPINLSSMVFEQKEHFVIRNFV